MIKKSCRLWIRLTHYSFWVNERIKVHVQVVEYYDIYFRRKMYLYFYIYRFCCLNFIEFWVFFVIKHVLFHKNKGTDFTRDLFFHSSTALVGIGLLIDEASRSYSDTLHSVGLLWPSQRPVAERPTCQHTPLKKTDNLTTCGFRTHSPKEQATAVPRLISGSTWNRLSLMIGERVLCS
jgi:hypothetical protein